MHAYTTGIECCAETGLFVGFLSGFPAADSQGQTLDDLHQNLAEVIAMLLAESEPRQKNDIVAGDHTEVGTGVQ
jgi:predicted RNase H-like HicB family nuclease